MTLVQRFTDDFVSPLIIASIRFTVLRRKEEEGGRSAKESSPFCEQASSSSPEYPLFSLETSESSLTTRSSIESRTMDVRTALTMLETELRCPIWSPVPVARVLALPDVLC